MKWPGCAGLLQVADRMEPPANTAVFTDAGRLIDESEGRLTSL